MLFYHTGDLHLGRTFYEGLPEELAEIRREELWNTLEYIIDLCKKDQADILFVSGDLYEKDYFTTSQYYRLQELLESVAPTQVFLIAGNHDSLEKGSYFSSLKWKDNVHVFKDSKVSFIDIPSMELRILGHSWNSPINRELFSRKELPIRENWHNILLLHGTNQKESNYLPFDPDELKDLTYVALGHIHKPERIRKNIAYCGCPEPLSFGEKGDRGIYKGFIDKNSLELEFIKTNIRTYREIERELTGVEDFYFLKEDLLESMDNKKDFYRINLKGTKGDVWELSELQASLDPLFDYIQWNDSREEPWDIEELKKVHQKDLLGTFLTLVEQENVEESVKKMAIEYGIWSLKGE